MKWSNHFRLLAVSVLMLFLLAGVPSVQAAASFGNRTSLWEKLNEIEQQAKEREKERRKDDDKWREVPEGSDVAFLVLGAGVLAAGVVVWRRKLVNG
jgi:hypothetical protein